MPENYDFLTPADILTPARSEAINSSVSQITALQDTQMIEWIHTLNSSLILAFHTEDHAGGASWMKKTDNFSIYVHTSLSAAAAAAAATFVLTSATNWDTTGRSVIETARGALDFVDHSANASNTLTVSTASGAETISIAHASGNWVHKLYPVAADFGRVHKLWVNQREFTETKFDGMFPRYERFALYGQYILLPRGSYTADGTMLYEKAPADITALTTTTNIPRRFLRWAVYSTLFHLYGVRRKRGDLKTTLEMADIELQKALNYDKISSSSTQIRLA